MGLGWLWIGFTNRAPEYPGENIFFTHVFLIFRSILTTLVLLRPHIYNEFGRPVGKSVRPVPAGTLAPQARGEQRPKSPNGWSFEVSGIKCNGMMGHLLLVEDGGDESGGVD